MRHDRTVIMCIITAVITHKVLYVVTHKALYVVTHKVLYVTYRAPVRQETGLRPVLIFCQLDTVPIDLRLHSKRLIIQHQ